MSDMEREVLLAMMQALRDLLDSSVTDAQIEKFTFGYLDGGYIDLGFPDLAKSQTLLNVAFIIIDKIRPIMEKRNEEI